MEMFAELSKMEKTTTIKQSIKQFEQTKNEQKTIQTTE
jgi:hypothetical protein